jgi:hypothetical protein
MKLNKPVILLFLIILFINSTYGGNRINIALNRACYQSSSFNYTNVAHLSTDGQLSTFWKSRNELKSWIYVDLGGVTRISEVVVKWGTKKPNGYQIEFSSEGNSSLPQNWELVFKSSLKRDREELVKFANSKGRFVRISCIAINEAETVEIAELEVYGKPLNLSKERVLHFENKGDLTLNGDNWYLQHYDFVSQKGEQISNASFIPRGWIPASVPSTVLSNYLALGALPDPNYADQQLMISEGFFTSDFWYQTKLNISDTNKGKKIWLNFNGINWKGDIYFNGHYIGKSEGVYKRSVFDITNLAQIGKPNGIAVLVYQNAHPGDVTEQHLFDPDGNGGIIGYDSPTILASIGWNWMPTVRGRNSGIWSDVFLNFTNGVSIENPFISTKLNLPDTTEVKINLEVLLNNTESVSVDGILKGIINGKNFEYPVSLIANEKQLVKLNSDQIEALKIENPKLWWPNGYGDQPLYDCKLEFHSKNSISDKRQIRFGIRHYTYTIDNNNLRISVNGKPIIARGGNWGMAESMLRCDSAGYDVRVRLHKDMNMNMIRNWIGSVGHDEFYDACDKYGIMVWDDFWLANPVDGPHPLDTKLFMATVDDKILQLRNHPSIVLWCGRNEGYPPAVLDSAMAVSTATLDPTRFYLSSSAHSPVTGLGPYETKDPKWYFTQRGTTFHSEQGIVSPPNYESLAQMMPKDKIWPINDLWGLHDWTQPRVSLFYNDMVKSYGEPKDAFDFCKKAQLLNMEGPKAMFESWQSNRGPGVLVWMSHPAWPSLICQSYDYYFDATASYYAFKKAGEPLHIMWRADNEKVQIVNNTFKDITNSKVVIEVFDFWGKQVLKSEKVVDCRSNSVTDVSVLEYPINVSSVHFIKLQWFDQSGNLLSDNFYWRGSEYMNYKAMETIGKAKITSLVKSVVVKNEVIVKIELTNSSTEMALMVRLMAHFNKSGDRVLPLWCDDNYLSLSPGTSKTITVTIPKNQYNQDKINFKFEGLNVDLSQIN